jgi:hypothetical protein
MGQFLKRGAIRGRLALPEMIGRSMLAALVWDRKAADPQLREESHE